jgi:hypothetical protein
LGTRPAASKIASTTQLADAAIGSPHPQHFALASGLDADLLHRHAQAQVHAVAGQRRGHHRGRLVVVASQNPGMVAQQRHLRTQPGKRLRQLTADRPRADDRQPRRLLGEGEDASVGQVARLGQAGNIRHRRPATRGNDGAVEVQGPLANGDALAIDEAARAEIHVHAQLAEASGRVVVAQMGTQSPHPRHHRREVHAHAAWHAHAKRGGGADVGGGLGRGQQRLRRHAADVQTIPAE